MRTRSRVFLLTSAVTVMVLMLGLIGLRPANADELYGRVRGLVTDTSGASLAGVHLTLTDVLTGISQNLDSDSAGSFVFPSLKPGTYKLVATKDGFKKFEADSIKIDQNVTFVQNINLELGTVTETVEVTANQAQVEQTSIQLTNTIDAKTVTDLPLVGRNWITLQQTLPGVVTPDTRFGTNYSTNGSQAQQNSYLINGNDNNDLPLNSPQVVPNPDAVEEVKLVTSTINPEFGRNSGAILNAVTKSGTNSFHGDGFWFYRDTFLNTHNFFTQSVPVFHQNLYGGTVGGPVLKNKLFFFYALQIIRARQPDGGTQTNTVFTPAQLAGNFSASTLTSNPIPFVGGIQGPDGHCAQGTPWNACFVGGMVPTSDFNSMSATLVKQFVPAAAPGTNQASFNPVTVSSTNQQIGRMDYTLNEKNSIWFYALANDNSAVNGIPFSGATLPGFGDQSAPYTKQFTASWGHTFTTDILNEFRVGYTRLNFPTGQPNNVRQPASVGFPTIFPQLPSGADYPQLSVAGYFTLGGTNNGPQPRKDQTYQLTDNFTWIKGKHSLKFGYDGREFQVWNPFAANNDGTFNFNTSGTYSTGDPGLDFLLGIPAQFIQGSGAVIEAQAFEHYLYAQDQWRVKANLTLTLGAGYQIDTPIKEYQNQGLSRVCFQPGVQSGVFPTAPPGYTLPGDPGCNEYGGASTKYNHIGPRAGLAYTPNWGSLTGNGKTSIRAGFGLYFNRGEEELNLQDLSTAPFGLTSMGVAGASTATTNYSPSFPNPYQDIASSFSVTPPFPYVPPKPGTAGIDFAPFEPFGFNLNTIPKNFTTPHAYNYNLTLERQLPGEIILRVGYVGSHGSDLITSYTFNPILQADIPLCLADPTCTSAGGRANLPINHPNYYPYDGSIWGSGGQISNHGFSNYNSLQVTVEKHLSHGLQFLSAYTYAHAQDVSSSFEDSAFQPGGGVNPYGNFQRDYGDSAFDARHRWVLSLDYEIPSLKHVWSVLPSRVFDGWRVTGINAVQTGFPILLQDSNNFSLTCDLYLSYYGCPDRPDLVSTPTILNPKTSVIGGNDHYWFNPSAFTDNAVGTLGDVGRGYLRGPGYWNTDVSLQKDTTITERTRLQLRFEAYNVFNHTNFANPDGNVADGTFGRISSIRAFTNSREFQLAAKFFF